MTIPVEDYEYDVALAICVGVDDDDVSDGVWYIKSVMFGTCVRLVRQDQSPSRS